MKRKYDVVAVGELLADLIGTEFTSNLSDTEIFRRFQGGSPANLAANMARLGNKTALVAAVGDDNVGRYLIREIEQTGIDTSYIVKTDTLPTSIVLVSRTKGTPDFIAYRTADAAIESHHIPDDLLANAAIFHTTCFALSKQPAQSSIIDAAQRARRLGCVVSLDANYAPSIWTNRQEAHEVVSAYCAQNAFIKLSEDDAERLFGEPRSTHETIAYFHDKGAQLVCLTLGSKGSIVSSDFGKDRIELDGKVIEVKDATGAGDAYWSGFLTAWLDKKTPTECASAAANMAIIKISTVGSLPPKIDKTLLYK